MKGFVRWWNGMPVAGRLVVGLLFGGIVFTGVGLSFDWTSGAIVVGILLGAVVLFLLVRWLVTAIERRRGQGLSAKLWSRMSTGEGGGVDATSEELSVRQEMQRRWKDVHDTLRERQYDYYSFPWYLILGAAQSGKTTTIQQSNQEFPIGAEPVIDYGGTKGCNWFFTNKAILIDTAGRYVEHLGEEDADWDTMLKRDQEEWETFLRLLKEERGRSPINGVIVTVKLEDLLEQDPRRQKKISESLRKALIHIEEQLEIRVPVYVLVTMMDLLVGFIDFFKNLPGLSDRSLFGWSRPGAYDKPFDPTEFRPAFASLANRVDSLLLEFMESQAGRGDLGADTSKLDRMLAFPDEFRSLGEPLAALLESLFKKSAYNEQHFFRGVYFTSGRQEGRPVMNACLSLVGDGTAALQEEDVALSSGGGNKAYFIADLYEEKVFHEAGLVRMTKRASSSQRLKKRAYLTVAAVLAIAAALWVMQEVTEFQRLDVFDPSALTALGARDFARADIEIGAHVLVEDSGFAGVAKHLADLRSDDYRDATILGRDDLDETASALLGAYRKLYADKVFATLLDDFIEEQRATEVTDWRRCLDLTDVLLGLRALGRGDEFTLEAFRTELLPVMKSLHLSVVADDVRRIDYERIGELAESLGDGDGCLARVSDRARARMDDLAGLLRTRVTTFWLVWLGAFDGDPLSPEAAIAPNVTQVEPVWRWLRMRSLDEAVAERVGDLTLVLENAPAAGTDLARFERDCVAPWRTAFDALESLRGELDAHVAQTGVLHVSSAEACESLEKVFAPLEELAFESGRSQSDRDLAQAIDGVRADWRAARDELGRWNTRVSKGEGVVTVSSREVRDPGFASEAIDRAADVLGVRSSEWTFSNRLDRVVWRHLGEIDELVSGDPSIDPILDPGSVEFWSLREESAFAKWLAGPVSTVSAASDGGGSLAVKKLIDVASEQTTLDELRAHRRAAFYEALRLKIAEAPERTTFLRRIDITRLGGRFLSGVFAAGLSEHPANADVAFNLGRVCTTLRAKADQLTMSLLDKLYMQYLDTIFVPFWKQGLVDVARESQLVPALPPEDYEGFRTWHAGLVASPTRALDGVTVLAQFAGGQEDRFDELFAGGKLANAQDRMKPARDLWQRYRLEPGKSTATAVDRLRVVASGLANAMSSLAQQPSDATPYERLHAAQRGTPVYDGLMEPARLQHAGSAADPIVRVLVDTAASVRVGLGKLASRLFVDNWAALGPGRNGPASRLVGRFPFERDPSWGGDNTSLVSRDEAEGFFGDAYFRQLVEVVYAHLDELGPSSDSLYVVDFPTSPGDHRAVFRRCVELRDLCGFDKPNGSQHDVAVELYDSSAFVEGSVYEDWSTQWTFDLTQGTPRDKIQLVLPFLSPKVGDLAARWVPSKESTVQFTDSRPGIASGDRWRYAPTVKVGKHWANALAFVYANPRATASEMVDHDDTVSTDGVRWIKLPLQRGSLKVTRVLGVRLPGMPDELPDLDSVWPR